MSLLIRRTGGTMTNMAMSIQAIDDDPPGDLLRRFADTWTTIPVAQYPLWRDRISSCGTRALARNPEAMAASFLIGLASAGVAGRIVETAPLGLPPLSETRESLGPRAHLTILATTLIALSDRGRWQVAERLSRYAIASVGALTPDEYAACQDVLPWLWVGVGEALFSAGRLREAIELLEEARSSRQEFPRFLATATLSFAFALDGALDPALEASADAAVLGPANGWWQGSYSARALAASTIVHCVRWELGAVAVAVTELRTATAGQPLRWRHIADQILASSFGMQGLPREGLAILDAINNVEQLDPLLRDSIAGARARLLLESARPGLAVSAASAPSSDLHHVSCHESARAFGFIALGLPSQAIQATQACVDLGGLHSMRTVQDMRVARAAAFHLLDRPQAAARELSRAVVATSVGGRGWPNLLPSVIVDELVEVAEQARITLPENFAGSPNEYSSALDECFRRFSQLSGREREVATLVRRGASVRDVADTLYLSPETLKAHLRHIAAKFGVRTRKEIEAIAEAVGFYELSDAMMMPQPE